MRFQSFVFFIIGCLYAFPIRADHLAGAEIQYTYIGHLTNSPNQYRVELLLYRDASGIHLPNTQTIHLQSSCFQDITFLVQRSIPSGEQAFGDQGFITRGYNDCVSPLMTGMDVSSHYYSGIITLPGSCADFRFYWWGSSRNPSDNLLNASSHTLFVHAGLNNIHGPNSSPRFVGPAIKAFCAGTSLQWSHRAEEPDGDSLHYRLVPAAAGSSFPPALLSYAPGFSDVQPLITTSGSGGVRLDSSSGILGFTAAFVQQVAVLVVEVREFRRDGGGQYHWVGSSMRDLQVVIASGCKDEVMDGPALLTTVPGFSIDTLSGDLVHAIVPGPIPHDSLSSTRAVTGVEYALSSLPYTCYQNTIRLEFQSPVQCRSIALDASDFALFSPDSIRQHIAAVHFGCDADQMTDVIDIVLFEELRSDGDYLLLFERGTDGSTLLNACGFGIPEYQAAIIRVRACYYPVFAVYTATVDSNHRIRINYTFDSTSFPADQLDELHILRSNDNGQTYQLAGALPPAQVLQKAPWFDPVLQAEDFREQHFSYQVQAVVNQRPSAIRRSTSTICLDTIGHLGGDRYQLNWNRWEGAADPIYTLWWAENPSDPLSWQPCVTAAFNPSTDTSAILSIPSGRSCITLRVDAQDVYDGHRVSRSNWLPLCIVERVVDNNQGENRPFNKPDVVVPNVFSPNGDGQNDRLYIAHLDQWDRHLLTIYDRRGAIVYQSSEADAEMWDGRSMRNGGVLMDGVYFYRLEMSDLNSGEHCLVQGDITVFSQPERP